MKKKSNKKGSFLVKIDNLIEKGESICEQFEEVVSAVDLEDDLIEKINHQDQTLLDEYKEVVQFSSEVKNKINKETKERVKKIKKGKAKTKLDGKKVKKTRFI